MLVVVKVIDQDHDKADRELARLAEIMKTQGYEQVATHSVQGQASKTWLLSHEFQPVRVERCTKKSP